jgi:Raf kinase inhibitor-like YbhB/YbcL family protein
MILTSTTFADGQAIPGTAAFCIPHEDHHVCLGANRNPHLAWSGAPAGTQSFVVICCDPDVPSVGDNVNQEGRTVPAELPRVDFFHWLLIDLPATCTDIAEGSYSAEVTPRGKAGPATAQGGRQGVNDYTAWFAGDADMRGDYYGYDGPCPPWNDLLPHRYRFSVYALDLPALPLDGAFTGTDVRDAMRGHILDEATLTGRYTLNPQVSL